MAKDRTRLVIVDDNDDRRELLVDECRRLDAVIVAQACNAEEVQLEIDRARPAIVVVDERLPDRDAVVSAVQTQGIAVHLVRGEEHGRIRDELATLIRR